MALRHFDRIFEQAADRKGGPSSLEDLLPKPKSAASLKRIPNDRWLSEMTKCVFQAGFVWRVVRAKWDDFERVFDNFDLYTVAYLSDDAIDELVLDPSIIRHHKKLLATRENAAFLLRVVEEFGTAGKFFAASPRQEYIDLLAYLKKHAARMGGMSAQYFLRQMGKDSFILSRDVVTALIREGVVDKPPASQRDMRAVQDAFNVWSDQSNRGLSEISRTLSMTVEA